MKKGHRMSLLTITEMCSQAARLGEEVNASGRAAAMSSAFHARCAGVDASALIARLTTDERDEIATWHRPEPYQFPDGGTFSYDRATKEAEVHLEHGDARSTGHPDAYDYDPERRRLMVLDLKRSAFTQRDPSNLQNAAYLLALLPAHPDAAECVTGIWPLDGSGYRWGAIRAVDDFELAVLAERVRHAATNESPNYNTGEHCGGCYSRSRCPAYLVPPEAAGEEFRALAYPDGLAALTLEDRGRLVLRLKGLEDNIDAMKKQLAEDAKRCGGYPGGAGKVWRAVEVAGRESVSVADVKAAGRADLVKQGKPFTQMKWTKE